MKVSVEQRSIEMIEVEYTPEELRKMLHFDRGDGTKERLPQEVAFSWTRTDDGYRLRARFQIDATRPEPSGLTQQEIDVWGLIRQAGSEGITYHRLENLMDGTISLQGVGKVVRSLVERRLVTQAGKETRKGAPPRKLWRSIE